MLSLCDGSPEAEQTEWRAWLSREPQIVDQRLPASARVELPCALAAVHHGQDGRPVRLALDQVVVELAAEAVTLGGRVDVDLGDFEGVSQPIIAVFG